jgi:hypothetical protein
VEAQAARAERQQTSNEDALTLDVYGLRISVDGDWPQVADELVRDYAWFRTSGPTEEMSDVRVTVRNGPPDFDGLGDLHSTFVTPRNVVYQQDDTTVVDYFGRAVSVLDRRHQRIEIQGEDPDLVHEAAYLFLLSRIGEHLDQRGLPRLHALGLSGKAGAVAVMLPSGGGKSTLALQALRDDGCRLLSEDSPLIDRAGVVHPFPLRIGVNATDEELLPDWPVRKLERMEFHPKLALEVEAFADRIEPEPRPLRHLVIGRRTLGRSAQLEPLPRRSALGPLLRESVVGVGLYQGMEFVLQRGMTDMFRKTGTAAMRARCAAAALRGAKVWQLWIGRDHARNWEALRGLLDD